MLRFHENLYFEHKPNIYKVLCKYCHNINTIFFTIFVTYKIINNEGHSNIYLNISTTKGNIPNTTSKPLLSIKMAAH